MNAIGRDWASLLPELVCTIARKVVDISDFIRFRAVCKTWRSITTITDMSPQFPWLLIFPPGPYLDFYSIVFDKSFTIHVPKLSYEDSTRPCLGSMLLHSSSKNVSCSLINPLNNSEVCIPSMRDYIYYRCIGSRGYQSKDYVFVQGSRHLHVFKPGDDKWIDMERKDCETFFHLKNLLFIVDVSSRFTKVINPSTHETAFVVPPPQNAWMLYTNKEVWSKFHRYPTLIESYGEVLIVTYADEFKKFVIHRLEVGNGEGNPHWVEVTSIGDRILFIDFTDSCGDFSLRASDFYGFNLKGNCIYYIKARTMLPPLDNDYYYVVQKYDIESATTEDLYIQEEGIGITWYLPTLNHI